MTAIDCIRYLESKSYDICFTGNAECEVYSISNLENIVPHSICWIKTKRNITSEIIENIRAAKEVLVVTPIEIEGLNCIITSYPKGVFFDILNHFFYKKKANQISDKAIILTKELGKNVNIGANCYIGEDVTIGDNTIIHPNVSIICPCVIGESCEIFPGVVIGADGFGYYFEGNTPYREKHFMGVKIGNHVDIGANTCIDRGLITDTVIMDHVKIDNLCHISHNVVIEENCLVIAGTVICGSAKIRRNSYLAPASVVLDHVVIEEKAKVGANSLAINEVKSGTTVFGVPGKNITR